MQKLFSSFVRVLQGALIGLGAVLPGISGGVLCVLFGIYQQIMALLVHPFKTLKESWKTLLPVLIGVAAGFLGIAKLLGVVLDKYPGPSVCLFVGLIAGMVPALFRDAGEQGRGKGAWIALVAAFVLMLGFLLGLNAVNVVIAPGFGAYLLCGVCLALSVIAPGMSFSTLLMPLGLYTPLLNGISSFDPAVLLPVGIGAVVTVLALARLINYLVENHHAIIHHAILVIVVAATIVIIPVSTFTDVVSALVNVICLAVGAVIAVGMDKLGEKVKKG